jgi:hypothetical protein
LTFQKRGGSNATASFFKGMSPDVAGVGLVCRVTSHPGGKGMSPDVAGDRSTRMQGDVAPGRERDDMSGAEGRGVALHVIRRVCSSCDKGVT